jgi:PAS domain S-box-containing protein
MESGVDAHLKGRKGHGSGRRSILPGLLLAFAICFPAWSKPLTVVLDDSYPPYVFRDSDGRLQGILPDIWALWSRKTGVSLVVEGTDWAEAQRRFRDGEADVIDTMFRTPEREKLFDFSAPYATIPVPIYFTADLSGISDASTLRGFTVGVKDGDACVEYLENRGLSSFQRYPSYEGLVAAAGRGEIRTMCVDQPPATYFMVKSGLQDRFRATAPLYSGQFHWAVMKGRADLKAQLERGFLQITAAERRGIEERWFGRGLPMGIDPELLRHLRTAGLVVPVFGALLLAWVWSLRRQVAARTRDLSRTLSDLAASEARFHSIFDSINDAILIHDTRSGAILDANRRAEEMYGWTADEFRALDVERLSEGTPPHDQEHALDFIRRSAAEPQVFEWHARHRNGTLFWTEVSIRRALLDGGEERLLVVVRDISERKAAERRLNRTIEALTRSNADLESFAYAASHDLREPLTTVVRYTQMLESRHRAALGPNGAEALDFILRGVRQMMRLVDGLLDYARIDKGGRRPEAVDVGAVLAETLEALAPAIAEAGAGIAVEPLPGVTGDPVLISQLFQNLIVNALKYRSPDRPLRVAVSGRRLPDGTCEFRVADNGIGIEPAYRDQVFVIFKRLHTQQAIPGGGIGLALCKRIVERHGGRIRIEDNPGGGTRFVFTIGTEAD